MRVPLKSKRAQGMPGEGLTHGPRAVKKHGEGTTGSAGSSGIPCAMAYGLYVISLGTGLSCSHCARDHLASLTPASGCQDHTTSPSASAPFVRTIARAHRQSVLRIPASRVVTIAMRPSSSRRDAGRQPHYSEKRKMNIFSYGGWTEESALKRLTNFDFSRTGF